MKNDLTYYLATFWGAYLIFASLILLIFPVLKTRMLSFVKVDYYRLLLGIILSVIGLLHISFHNIWSIDVSVIITLFGWMCLTKGIILIMYNSLESLVDTLLQSNYLGFVYLFMICLGFYLIQAVNPFLKF